MIQQNLGKHITSAFLFILFCIIAAGSIDTDTDTQKVQLQPASYMTTADQLYRDYDSNEVLADENFKGKVIIVSGTIQDIGKDIMDNAYIVIGGRGLLDGVQCTFTKGQQSSVARLSKGQRVSVKGEVAGKMGNVLINKASLQ